MTYLLFGFVVLCFLSIKFEFKPVHSLLISIFIMFLLNYFHTSAWHVVVLIACGIFYIFVMRHEILILLDKADKKEKLNGLVRNLVVGFFVLAVLQIIFSLSMSAVENRNAPLSNPAAYSTTLPTIPTPIPSQQKLHGADCKIDCFGHEEGYKWADEKGINDPSKCNGKSDSFIEGCQIYAKEHPYASTSQLQGLNSNTQITQSPQLNAEDVEAKQYKGSVGVIEYSNLNCNSHYIASINGQFVILRRSLGAATPSRGDNYVGFSSSLIGMQPVWNKRSASETIFWVEYSSFSKDSVIEKFAQYCR